MHSNDSRTHFDSQKGNEEPSLSMAQRRKVLIYKILKQVCIIGAWFVMGLFVEVVGPTLPDLAKRIDVNYEEFARALSTKAIGLFVGSLLGGFLHEVFYQHTDLIICLGILSGAIGIGFVPRANSLGLMAFLLSLTGFAGGMLNTGGNTLVFHLWGENAASPIHSTHFGFGLGAIVAPQIARPFLVESSDNSNINMTTTMILNMNTTDNPGINANMISELEYPYGIIACLTAFIAFLMLLFYIIPPPKGLVKRNPPPLAFQTLLSPATCSGGRLKYGSMLLIFLFLYFLHATGGERAYGKYISTFSQESSLQFTKAQSANLASVFWACHVSGRFSGIILSKWVPTYIIIVGDICLAILTSVLLASFGYSHSSAIWVLSGMLGFSISLFFPCGMSWANLKLDMNSMSTMVMLMGAAVGGLVYQYLPGYLLQTTGTRSLMWVMVVYAGLISLTFAILAAIVKIWGCPRNIAVKTEDDESTDNAQKSAIQESKA